MPASIGNNKTAQEFLQGKAGLKSLKRFPDAGPEQRGPSCGFYALGMAMQY